MITRSIETKSYLRNCVSHAAVVEIEKFHIVLKTWAPVKRRMEISSADSAMFEQAERMKEGTLIEGSLRIDVCAEGIFRVRYAQGSDIPENTTPMVVGTFPSPNLCHITHTSETIVITTTKCRAVIHLTPYSLQIFDLEGRCNASIGGREKNYFNNWDTANTGICYDSATGTGLAVENFALSHDEAIYGFGEKFIKLNKTGQTLDMDMADAIGVATPKSYKNIPFFVSTKGYGVFFNHSSLMTFWVGSMSAFDIQASIQENFLDYYIFTGSIKEILKSYTDLTGKGFLPPKWSFGFWQSKISYSSAEETLEIAKKMRENQLPCDVIHLDTYWFEKDWYCDLEFDCERFPYPKEYFEAMNQLGMKISLWQLPYIPEGSALFEELKSIDGFVKRTDGSIYDAKICFTEGFKGVVGIVDYTNPLAVKVHQDAFRKLFRFGAMAIKTDFGEAAPIDGVYHDGTPGYLMHNLYPFLYNQALSQVTEEETGNGMVWARSAWAGSQRYPIHWGGDNSPNFMNMAPQLAGGLSLGLSGFQFWSQDIGGFLGNTYDTLLTRWMQMGLFFSHVRIHGSGIRELYKFNPETIQICREFLQLRYRLLPYIYGSAMKCLETSLPMAKALVIEYQQDPNVREIYDQYLFGDALMPAPIVTENNCRSIYLPHGVWTDWWTGERISGGIWLEVKAPLDRVPLYIREGGLVPMGPVMDFVGQKPTNQIELLISLYESEGSSSMIVPADDAMIPVTYTFTGGKHTVNIGRSDVTFTVKTFGTGTVEVIYTV